MRSGTDAGRMLGAGVLLAALLGAAPGQALTIQTVQLTSSGDAEPVWGQSLTINVGATIPDASIPPVVSLDLVGFRTGDASIGSADRGNVYLHIYDGFGITAGGAVDGSAIGNLIAVSTNSLDLELAAPSTDAIWFFDGPSLAKDVPYYYVMASDTTAATSASFGNLVYSDLEVGAPNPHAGGRAFHQTGDFGDGPTSEDLFFRVLSSEPVPEPGTASLLGLGLALLAARSRTRRN